MSPSSVALPLKIQHSGSGILTGFPFDRWHRQSMHFETEFPYLLGSTHPCPTAVTMEPFSTSVFKDLTWIFATTTKICTRGRSSQHHCQAFSAWPPRLPTRQCIAATLTARYGYYAWAPSIFRASPFGRWVVTHSLADSNFHGHRPAV